MTRGLLAMLDEVYLLEVSTPDWGRLLGWLSTSRAATYLGVLLTYLHRRRLVELPPRVAHAFAEMPVPKRPASPFGAPGLGSLPHA
jgi:hypothetical protein